MAQSWLAEPPCGSEGGSLWLGARFAIRIEYFAGHESSERGASVPLKTGRYVDTAKALQALILEHFDRAMEVDVVPVATPYSLEVMVARHAESPRLQAAGPPPALLFSKIEGKVWPQTSKVLAAIRHFCQLPVRVILSRPADTACPASLRSRKLFMSHDGSKTGVEVQTDARNIADAVLFPGAFGLRFCDDGAFDELSPSTLVVPPVFERHSLVIVVFASRRFVIEITDQLGRGAMFMPLNFTRRALDHQGASREISVTRRTDAQGLCEVWLSEGGFSLSAGAGADDSLAEVERSFVVDAVTPERLAFAVRRQSFGVRLLLVTRRGEPVPGCGFSVRSVGAESDPAALGCTDDMGRAVVELAVGRHVLHVAPAAGSPLEETRADLVVNERGEVSPERVEITVRVMDVTIFFVTPSGEPAEHCRCRIEPKESNGMSAMSVDSSHSGAATLQLACFDTYVLRIDDEDPAQEYEPLAWRFTVQGGTVTAVVRRSFFGRIAEGSFVLLLDTSSAALHGCLPRLALGLRSALQGASDEVRFNIVAVCGGVMRWRMELAAASPEAIDDAARFCSNLPLRKDADACEALEGVLEQRDLAAAYFVTGGDANIDETFLKRMQVAHYRHPQRPRLHAILANGERRESTWRGMQALASFSRATFRAVHVDGGDAPSLAEVLAGTPRNARAEGGRIFAPSPAAPRTHTHTHTHTCFLL